MQFSKGSRVYVLLDDEYYGGKISRMKGKGTMKLAVVRFDDGDVLDIPVGDLVDSAEYERLIEALADEDEAQGDQFSGGKTYNPKGKEGGGSGFHTYPVTWSKDRMAFNCNVTLTEADIGVSEAANRMIGETVRFHGTWVRTNCFKGNQQVSCWDLMVYGELSTNPSYMYYIECIHYDLTEHDEETVRDDIAGRNMDICMAINKWFFRELVPAGVTLAELEKRASNPIINVPSLDYLDALIFKLKETRTMALRSGGQRAVMIKPATDNEPTVTLAMDFTSIAVATKGKPPPEMMVLWWIDHPLI